MRDIMSKYILDENNNPVLEDDLLKWGAWLQTDKRRVAMDTVGEWWVSTVFMGLDHSFTDDGPPVLWETMVFKKDKDDGEVGLRDFYMKRYTSHQDALHGHNAVVAKIKSGWVPGGDDE